MGGSKKARRRAREKSLRAEQERLRKLKSSGLPIVRLEPVPKRFSVSFRKEYLERYLYDAGVSDGDIKLCYGLLSGNVRGLRVSKGGDGLWFISLRGDELLGEELAAIETVLLPFGVLVDGSLWEFDGAPKRGVVLRVEGRFLNVFDLSNRELVFQDGDERALVGRV